MHINTNTYPTSGVFEVSYLNRRKHSSIYEITWRATASLSLDNLKGCCSVRYRKVSTQVMEKIDSNGITKEHVDDLQLPSSYESAMEALSSLISGHKRGQKPLIPSKYDKLERMRMYLKILGLEEHIAGLKIIHVAGTKGKGSTCTFCEAILRECGVRTGLFTSPHLIDVRERFRINGLEITEDRFLQHFWECWHKLEENITEDLPMPPLFQFLTVLAFKIFTSEQVDVAIVEVGIGGKNDSTNVIKEPVVCGITSLGMDHTETLGNTLSEIASHKAGIFKPKIPAFTVSQLSEAMEVIQERANELEVIKSPLSLEVPLEVTPALDPKKLEGLKLSLSGDHQLINAGLAVSLCKCWLQRTGNWEKLTKNDDLEAADLPPAFRRGLASAHISGRAQIIHDASSNSNATEGSRGDLIFYLDGAHSPESVEACANWFSSSIKENENSSVSNFKLDKMNGVPTNGHFQPELDSGSEKGFNIDNAKTFSHEFIHQDASRRNTTTDNYIGSSAVMPSLPLAIKWLRDCVKENPSIRLQVLVTGSLHLVGDVLKVLRR
ncbi:hypothetical protein F8388_025328 [Cannabis sativa]|uniref:Folylpolyglutamate synthase n=1 Tax=Cannabis sativa TaxID=3483 RepID=A0A7J6FSC7_CANSA|nr:hypothetical protein F8388_025328 [Cannabis sativa]